MTKSTIQKNHLVVKQNALNEMRSHSMTLQELRLFSVYLSKINPKDQSTRNVRFSMADFQTIMELNKQNITYFQKIAESLLNKPIRIPTGRGGFEMFQMFQVFIIDPDENGEWYVEIDANDRALPLMFDFKGHYFKYELWNALRLRSRNQLRMYEILKQYEKVGYRTMTVNELKEQLGIEESEYPRFNDFKSHVLEVCRCALSEYTDISYIYEPHGKKGRGGKVLQLKFTITKNKNFTDPLSLEKFIKTKNDFDNAIEGEYEEKEEYIDYYTEINTTPNSKINLTDLDENGLIRSTGTLPFYEERIDYLMTACNNEFSREEIVLLYSIMQEKVPAIHSNEHKSHDYLQHKYREMEMNDKKSKVLHRFAYFRKLVELGEG